MKKCNTCDEEFDNHFRFCPVDGTPIGENYEHGAPAKFQLTLIADERLAQRLSAELAFLLNRAGKAWPNFKKHPIAFTSVQLTALKNHLKGLAGQPYVRPAASAALAVVVMVVLGVALLEKRGATTTEMTEPDDLSVVSLIDVTNETSTKSDPGIGAGEKGRVGFGRGQGQGSNPLPARAQGGGGGGTRNPLPPSLGKPPVASPIPAPIPTTYARLPQALPAAGLDIDPALWRNLDLASYGDPRSKSTTPSNGPGEGGGVGTGRGAGIGEGEDNGFGPGRKGNMGDGDNKPGCCGEGGSKGNNSDDDPHRIFKAPEVSSRPRVISKPEPQYTEQARRDQITGTVILRVVFSGAGEVTNIQAVQKLGGGLTEKAIAAARQIRFTPAMRNGRPVSMFMQLEYNFNLY